MTASNAKGRRDRILDAAERLFSEWGIDGVSMREIAAEAGVQLALINYYFGTKQELYRAVFRRRIEPISTRRLSSLQTVLDRKQPPAAIEDVLEALARPWVELRDKRGGQTYTRLIAREAADPREADRGIVKELLDPVARSFLQAMEQALPGRSKSEIHWAYHYFIGALLLILMNPERLRRLSGPACDLNDGESVIGEIVGFFAHALKTPNGARPAETRPKPKLAGRTTNEARDVRRAGQRGSLRRTYRQ